MAPDIAKLYHYWIDEAEYSWEVANSLFESKKYPECLFFAHLTLEKIIKAMVVKETKEHAPPIHDLAKLAGRSGLILEKDRLDKLKEWNTFYLSGRYDEQKMKFRKMCNAKFTEKHFIEIKEYYLWLKQEAKKTTSRLPSVR
jgi:HEPN domain-containing protein